MKQIVDWIEDQDPSFTATKPQFNLLLRGSRDGFTPSDFHRLCDNKGPTITVIKVQNTGQLVGGYTPAAWHSSAGQYEKAVGTFIFSLGNESGDDVIQSKQTSSAPNAIF